jgi:CRISPR-associated endonuclease Csn1
VLTTFEANSKGLGSTRPHPTAKLIMRRYSKDPVAIEHPKLGSARLIIAKIDKNNIVLYQNNEANVDARHRDKNDPFKYVNVGLGTIKKYRLRKFGVDRLGRITDPGPFNN